MTYYIRIIHVPHEHPIKVTNENSRPSHRTDAVVPLAAIADNDEHHFCFIGSEQVPCPDQVNDRASGRTRRIDTN